jgi:hypothetical protein
VRLDERSRELLRGARIGMLALAAGRTPLVNPAAYWFGGDAVWITTSRKAVKTALARRRPAASFLVDGGDHCVLLEGELEVFDPFDLPSDVRAVLHGPGFFLNLAGYAWKNAPFIGGYLWDLAKVPREWWPHNRALLRLDATRAWSLPSMSRFPAAPAELGHVPPGVRRSLAREPVAYLCTLADGVPLMAPGVWAAGEGDELELVTGVASFLGISRAATGGVAIEYHHPYRATRMVGAYLRGRFHAHAAAKEAIAARFTLDEEPRGLGLRFQPDRVTWWRGFAIETMSLVREEHDKDRLKSRNG